MSGIYARDTSVPVERSRQEIEHTLIKYGADRFGYASEPGRAVVAFQIKDTTGTVLAIKMTLPLPAKGDKRFTHSSRGERRPETVNAMWEQACRSSWRSLQLVIRAKLEACAAGISTIEREFLADVLLPDGKTVGEFIRPQLPEVYKSKGMPRLLLMGGPA